MVKKLVLLFEVIFHFFFNTFGTIEIQIILPSFNLQCVRIRNVNVPDPVLCSECVRDKKLVSPIKFIISTFYQHFHDE